MLSVGGRAFSEELLRGAGTDRVALIGDGVELTRTELAERISRRVVELTLPERSLVLLSGSTSVEYVVTYMALLDGGHVPLLAPGHLEELADAWSPAATVQVGGDAGDVDVQHHDTEPVVLHPDLALLLSTSGSTGSPKLVRLSHDNLSSNARAIAGYLGLGPADRGITSLPLHYCYGLSVLHSHLVAGAGVVITHASVVDPCFRAALADHSVTTVAGVPYTFELLERAGPDLLQAPSLRRVTQAGGRMAPTDVRRWVERTASWGADFYVMYGQTEATARMAYLPPELALRRPEAIGRPIPGGELSLRPVDGAPDGVGELIYGGPNVMLGYAVGRDDLAAGRTVDELPTGDLARFHPDDEVFEIVGRRSRFVKPFGVRIDLDTVEGCLAELFDEVAVTGDDDRILVVAPGAAAERVRRVVTERTGLPHGCIVVDTHRPIPRTASGKVDYGSVASWQTHGSLSEIADEGDVAVPTSVADVYATVLGRGDIGDDDTFVSLGGDSLGYVECSLRLEAVLGRLPPDWHLLPIRDLTLLAHRHSATVLTDGSRPGWHVSPGRIRRWGHRMPRLDTTALLRAVGICAIVATHMHIVFFPGGAHLMLAVAGYNLSRFMMPIDSTRERVRAGLRTVARAAVPTVVWIGVGMALVGAYSGGTLLLVNNYVGPASHRGDHWHFWFIEVFAHLVVLTTLLLAIPAFRRLDARHSYGFPLVVLGVCLLLRMEWAQLGDWYNLRFRTHGVAWFFVLGWLIQRSNTVARRALTTVLCVVVIWDFFHYPQREWFITIGLVLLLWRRDVPVPRVLARPIGVIAAATMWILITHFTVWPPLARSFDDRIAYVLTITAGVLAWALERRLTRLARAKLRVASPADASIADADVARVGAGAGGGFVGGVTTSPLAWRASSPP